MGDSDLEYDSVILVSFGGPEQRADVMPFLENVVRGKNVPPERLKEVIKQELVELKERFADANVKLGLTWDDMKDVPSGEVAVARIQPGPGKAALVKASDRSTVPSVMNQSCSQRL